MRDEARQCETRRGEARQGKARQGKARQGKARQGKARQDNTENEESTHLPLSELVEVNRASLLVHGSVHDAAQGPGLLQQLQTPTKTSGERARPKQVVG